MCAVLDIPELYAGSDSGISLYTIFLFHVFLYMGIPHYYYRIYPETKTVLHYRIHSITQYGHPFIGQITDIV